MSSGFQGIHSQHSKPSVVPTFKTSNKKTNIDTSRSLLQKENSMSVPGLDKNWACKHRNKFLDDEFSRVQCVDKYF